MINLGGRTFRSTVGVNVWSRFIFQNRNRDVDVHEAA